MLRLDIVCPLCQGQKKIQCKTCNGTGILKKTLGIFPKYCPNCNKTGLVPCVCNTEGIYVQDILWYSEKTTEEQVQRAISFLKNFDDSIVIRILEQLLLKNASKYAGPILDLLNRFEWNPYKSQDERTLIRYALFNDKIEILRDFQNQIIFELRWYISGLTDSKKIDHVITLIFQINNPETFYVLKDILLSKYPNLKEKQGAIFEFLVNSDNGLKVLTSTFSESSEVFEECLRQIKNPQLIKAIGHFVFRIPSKKHIIQALCYLQENSVQEANNISQQLNQNPYTGLCSLLSHTAYLLIKREEEFPGLLNFITNKKVYLIDNPEIGLLNALSVYGDGGAFLLNTILETYLYDHALRATNYLEYMLTYRKDKLSQETLDRILQLNYREFKSGGTTTRYMPGAFGGTYTTSSPEECNVLSFKHIVKKV